MYLTDNHNANTTSSANDKIQNMKLISIESGWPPFFNKNSGDFRKITEISGISVEEWMYPCHRLHITWSTLQNNIFEPFKVYSGN